MDLLNLSALKKEEVLAATVSCDTHLCYVVPKPDWQGKIIFLQRAWITVLMLCQLSWQILTQEVKAAVFQIYSSSKKSSQEAASAQTQKSVQVPA